MTERGGQDDATPFDTASEWQSFGHGVYNGMKDWKPGCGPLPDNRHVQAAPGYFKWGFVVGSLLQTLGMLLFVAGVVGVL